jgi:hypothetical protein
MLSVITAATFAQLLCHEMSPELEYISAGANGSNDNYAIFKHVKSGTLFYASTQDSDGKVKLSVHLPQEWHHGGSGGMPEVQIGGKRVARPSIKMNPDKSIEKVVVDFRGRLLSDGVDWFLKCKERHELNQSNKNRTFENKQAIAKACGTIINEKHRKEDASSRIILGVNGEFLTFDVSDHGASVEIPRMSIEKVVKLIELLKG